MCLSRDEQHSEAELKCFMRGILTESLLTSTQGLSMKEKKMVIAKLFDFLIECADKRNDERAAEGDDVIQSEKSEIVRNNDRSAWILNDRLVQQARRATHRDASQWEKQASLHFKEREQKNKIAECLEADDRDGAIVCAQSAWHDKVSIGNISEMAFDDAGMD